jgi:hypothetical protein
MFISSKASPKPQLLVSFEAPSVFVGEISRELAGMQEEGPLYAMEILSIRAGRLDNRDREPACRVVGVLPHITLLLF